MTTPLLSEHKTLFVWNRLLETLSGGIRLFIGAKVPAYVLGVQVGVHQQPFLLGAFFTVLIETWLLSYFVAACSCGLVVTATIALLQGITIRLQSHTSPLQPVTTTNNSVVQLEEEDLPSFQSCFSASTAQHLFPRKRFFVVVVHTLMAGCLTGYGVVYFTPSRLNGLYSSMVVSFLIFFLGWTSLCTALFSLTSHAPPETATFQPMDKWGIKPFMRPFYVILCFTVDVINWTTSHYVTLNAVVHIAFIFLPLVWFLNLLPPLDALLLWCLEQLHVWIAGGSPSAAYSRLVFNCFLWCGSVVAIYLLPPYFCPLVAAVLGYLLSLDIGYIWSGLIRICTPKATKKKQSFEEHYKFASGWHYSDVFYFLIMLIAVILLSSGLVLGMSRSSDAVDTNRAFLTSMGVLLVVLVIVSWIGRSFGSVYIFGGFVRNCIYPPDANQPLKFASRRRWIERIGRVRFGIVNIGVPLVITAYVEVLEISNYSGDEKLFHLWHCISLLRAFRWSWQQTENALTEVTVVYFLLQYTEISKYIADPTCIMLLIAVIHDRLCSFLNKLHTIGILLLASIFHEKQRRSYSWCLFMLNLACFPFLLVFLLLSTVFDGPLLPLFTLPFFWLGFPRPICFWPRPEGEFDTLSPDAVYYEEVEPRLTVELGALMLRGSLGSVRPGDQFLLRYGDRFIWLSVLEKGYGYTRVTVKGLELQQTSCHAVEATAVDAILEWAFESETIGIKDGPHAACKCCCQLNRTSFHIYRPLVTCAIETYVDTRNVLTGVLNSPETLQLISDYFPKCLLWILRLQFGRQEAGSHGVSSDPTAAGPGPQQPPAEKSGHQRTGNLLAAEKTEPGLQRDGAKTPKSRPSTADRYAQLPKMDNVSIAESSDPWLDDDDDPLDGIAPSASSKSDKKLSVPLQLFKLKDESPPSDKTPVFSSLTSDFGSAKLPGSIDDSDDQDASCQTSPIFRAGVLHGQNAENAASELFEANPEFPSEWLKSSISRQVLRAIDAQFSAEWYDYVTERLSCNDKSPERHGSSKEAECVRAQYRQLVLTCHSIVNQVTSSTQVNLVSPSRAHRIFNRELPWSPLSDWLLQNQSLYDFVIHAYRYACKMALDQTLLGDIQTHSDMADCLQEYDDTWFIGADSEPLWTEAVRRRVPNLFSLGYNSAVGTYTSHLLTRRLCPVHVGRLNRETVRAIWSTLNLELLYLTNDDEERYSIQAHSWLLRNLTVQGADPPLGYPIYMSSPLLVKITPSLCSSSTRR